MKRRKGLLIGVWLTAVLVAGGVPGGAADAKDGVTHVDAKQAAAELKKGEAAAEKIVIIDVRTPDEFAAGHLKGAKNIDFLGDDFRAGVAKLDRDKRYLLHCKSGGRSRGALKVFTELGFKRLLHLDGGFAGWEKAGLPVVN